jgi:hypothetical protein
MGVGLREVAKKRHQWCIEGDVKKANFLGKHLIPVVVGPKQRMYCIDHHHLLRALHEEGVEQVLVNVVARFDRVPDMAAFWFIMDIQRWVFPWDEDGQRHDYAKLPKSIDRLADDEWRSLAGAVQESGGFAKEVAPFSEFVWADFFRRRMKVKSLTQDFKLAVYDALQLARSDEAQYLPGWCGPHNHHAEAPPTNRP